MPKLSIITVNLNNKVGLIDTAQSVVAQTWTDYEWILIDGGSTDGSVEVIREYADKRDKLVYWCSEPDDGIYQGMNKGIEKASGEYCWFLNSGDYAYKNTTLAEIFDSELDEDIVKGILIIEKKNQTYIIWDSRFHLSPYQKKLPISDKEIRCPIYWTNETFPHQATLTKTKIIRNVGCFDHEFKIGADLMFFMLAVVKNNASVKYIPVKFAVFNERGLSGNSKYFDYRKKEKLRMYKKMFILPYWVYRILHIVILGRFSFWRNTYIKRCDQEKHY
jgi:glycosyltransferase involved in cell wall biosynthesis